MNRGTPGTTKIGGPAIGSGGKGNPPIPREMRFNRGAMWRALCRPIAPNKQQTEKKGRRK